MKRLLIEGHDAEICAFVRRLAPFTPDFMPGDKAFGILNDRGELIGGVVFGNWHPDFGTLEMSAVAVSSYVLSPGIVLALGDYAYRQLSANRVWARTSTKNIRAIRLLRHIGFTPEGVEADYYGPSRHAGMFRMLRREWDARYSMREAA